ncbi:hypothetical protein TWF569_011687 [Orbilia oligospora]|uniref:DUF2231 domain-containing protein n=1 Tax=Orbilia oligospora TaxID=2813651 RepID=A0A7C8P938_ORBOL|nr:hypothetical protein TWF706_002363 [Orbilia oligospora]KAF3089213.1 hypothetical protein TWF102_009706 [Orbilia oligospora]KAF3101476.1 hypothetical protein TWF103_007897 [Orbilia oligospora]KAF3127743.1 hypothetical protein TWF569_011687 [Orbilia oligospora]KAF3136990.1 hypothetical protein TWF703_005310 [Orbilia oligospora]
MSFLSHPIHPALVHFPIAFLTFSHTIDILHYLTTNFSIPFLSTLSPLFPQLLSSSRLLHTLGIFSAIPAIITGIAQASAQAAKPGNLYEADGKTIKKKFYVMAAHAALNDLCVIVSGSSWWSRYKAHGILGAAEPGVNELAVAGVVLPVLLFAASLGGDLVYKHGMGFSAAKSAKKEQ